MRTKVIVICALLIVVSGTALAAEKNPAEVSIERIETVPQIMNSANLAAPVNGLCSAGNLDWYYAVSGWLAGNEIYSTFVDPSGCGCAGWVTPHEVGFVIDVREGIEICDHPVVRVDIRDAEWSGGCPRPGEILCQSGLFELGFPGAGIYIVELTLPPCDPVPGSFFVSLEYVGPVCSHVRVVTDDSPVVCNSYNDWGTGWVDLVADADFPGRLTMYANVECASYLTATVDIDPNTLNLKSKGKYVTCYIELDGADPAEIDLSTVMLNGLVPVAGFPIGPIHELGDYDMDGVPDLMVKFSRSALIASLAGPEAALRLDERGMDAAIEHGATYDMVVTGMLNDGMPFEGMDYIRIINPGGRSDDADAGGESEFDVFATPATGGTRISFTLDVAGHVNLRVFDAAGRLVRTLESAYKSAGTHNVTWDRRTDDGGRAGAGVYFIRLERHGEVDMQKLLLVE
jgi:hypothetical protein